MHQKVPRPSIGRTCNNPPLLERDVPVGGPPRYGPSDDAKARFFFPPDFGIGALERFSEPQVAKRVPLLQSGVLQCESIPSVSIEIPLTSLSAKRKIDDG